jgi:uncharacterized protein (UPF0305 family)
MKKRSTKKKTFNEKITENTRHVLGSINLSDVVDINSFTPADKLNYLKEAEGVYQNEVFQNELKVMVQTQLEFIGLNAKNYDEVIMGRGTMNGIDLMLERFSALHNEYIQAIKPEDTNFDRFNPLPERS